MGVYINMEMPKNCFDCRYICGLRDSQKFTKNRRPDCPLVPVPPHGRLGDLDAAVELVMQYCPDDDGTCSKAGADLRELLDEIESLPTIIPADPAEEGK